MTKTIIFLDFDGVLNNINDMIYHYRNRHITPDYHVYFNMVDHKNIRILNHLVRCLNADIVISSSWRSKKDNLCERTLKSNGFLYTDRIIDVTPRFWERRGYEIWYWLENNLDKWDRFIILDDDRDMEFLLPYLMKTDGWYGLQQKHIKKIVNNFSFLCFNKSKMIDEFNNNETYKSIKEKYCERR